MKLLFPLFFCSLFTASLWADAVTLKGHRYPRELEDHGVTWQIQGAKHFVYKVFFSVFTGAYYEQVEGGGKRLQFTYTRDLKADDLREQADKQLKAHNPEAVLSNYAEPLRNIQQAYLDVEKGDSYTITAIPGKGTWLELNGKERFFSEDGEFGLWYLDIWLGDPPIDESLKKALTGGANL